MERDTLIASAVVINSEAAIFEIGQVLGLALAIKASLLFLAAEESDERRLLDLMAAAKRAATHLGVTLWENEEDGESAG